MKHEEGLSPQPVIDYGRPKSRSAFRTALLCIALVLGAALLTVGGFAGWVWYQFAQMDRVDLVVENRSSKQVAGVALYSGDLDAGRFSPDHLGIAAVAPGATAKASKHLPSLGPAVLRMRVGNEVLAGHAGIVIDDDGPHIYRIVVTDSGVSVTRDYNEGPTTVAMRPVAR